MASGLLTGAMTRERIAALAKTDWRTRNEQFKEPKLSENLKLVERPILCQTSMVEQVLKEHGLNVRKIDQRVEIGSTEAIKSLVVAEIGIAFFSCWEIENELSRAKNLPRDTSGVAFYLAKRLAYSHLIWHLFVSAGTACHFCAVLWYAG